VARLAAQHRAEAGGLRPPLSLALGGCENEEPKGGLAAIRPGYRPIAGGASQKLAKELV